MNINPILTCDSYKISHPKQYPDNMMYMHSYIESRGGEYGYTKFFGLQYYLKKYLTVRLTKEMVDEASEIFKLHGIPFIREDFDYIVEKLDGKIPLRIRAVEEGAIIPNHNVLITVESTDKNVPYIVSWFETLLLKTWYPITVATYSYKIKQIIKYFLEKTCDNVDEEILFKLHDFGYRGTSSEESAGIGGLAHLTNFLGTDNIKALVYGRHYYNIDCAGFSIPAAEHSTITSWGRENEKKAIEHIIDSFKDNQLAVVCDSYNFFNAVEHIICEDLKDKIIKRDNLLVIRPDSGDAITNILFALEKLENAFGVTINKKGYKVLNHVRIIQGDSVYENTVWDILKSITDMGYSAENISLGSGGALLQGNKNSSINRDTHRFAMKCSSVKIKDSFVDVYKDPITDKGKISKKGRLDLIIDENEKIRTINITNLGENNYHKDSIMNIVFENGELLKEYSLEEIRENECKYYKPHLEKRPF
ncbi:nicotinate phosphoribosyltransferase [Oceanivirga miroungae]|uniref:Nicotinamide phosphoribosyltransferase n=1 Tax=Oceanivirga miroungae TaxID=1130046 RepID=A0A6I8M8J4_9FUSO|nr:nicotinate phosphoribosyltransferase [Oceanivirga miroungae]VWL85134.1 nicotinate phosphoribosyltransferase [Oceanivirga miroungae]